MAFKKANGIFTRVFRFCFFFSQRETTSGSEFLVFTDAKGTDGYIRPLRTGSAFKPKHSTPTTEESTTAKAFYF